MMPQKKIQEIIDFITIESQLTLLKDLKKAVEQQIIPNAKDQYSIGANKAFNKCLEYIASYENLINRRDNKKGKDYVEF